MIKKCGLCGADLQYDDENKVGYAPKKNAKVCQRCFKLKNYNQKVDSSIKYSNNEIIRILNKNADIVYFITDFLGLSRLVIDYFNKITVNKVLIINKSDYIPKSINKEKYANWVKETYNVESPVILASAKSGYNINQIDNLVFSHTNNYFCGFTNSGKSTMHNKICILNNKESEVLSSLLPNTTVDLIKTKLADKVYLFDTPGFTNNDIFDERLYPKKYVKPVTIQTKPNDIINVGNLLYIKTDDKVNSFTFYMSDQIKIKKIYDFDFKSSNEYEIDNNSDLFISNYGFINIKKKCKMSISKIDNYIEIRKSTF